jgi:hypothetical protein
MVRAVLWVPSHKGLRLATDKDTLIPALWLNKTSVISYISVVDNIGLYMLIFKKNFIKQNCEVTLWLRILKTIDGC